jgi:amino acid transporter
MTMAARVIYGMARQGDLPRVLGDVHAKTATPLRATAVIVAVVLMLALSVPFVRLAETTSIATLVVFALVNIALLRVRWKRVPAHGKVFSVPLWVPIAGLATCAVMIASALLG